MRYLGTIRARDLYTYSDLATGVVEGLGVSRHAQGRLALATPCYPGFFEMLLELTFKVVEIPRLGAPGAPAESMRGAPHNVPD